jgi:hypothetical protein
MLRYRNSIVIREGQAVLDRRDRERDREDPDVALALRGVRWDGRKIVEAHRDREGQS